MAKLNIKKGTTSVILSLFISDSSSTTGAGLAGLVFNSAGLTAKYKREGSAWQTITLQTATEGTWISGGFKEDSIAGGNYELGVPNAAFAAGDNIRWVRFELQGAVNMAPLAFEVQLDEIYVEVEGLATFITLATAAIADMEIWPFAE